MERKFQGFNSVIFFRKGRSTSSNLFILRCILEKSYELNQDSRLLVIAFGQAYNSINRIYLFEILKEFGVPKKLVNVMTMTLPDSHGKVKIQGQMSEVFVIERGLRQGGALSKHCSV